MKRTLLLLLLGPTRKLFLVRSLFYSRTRGKCVMKCKRFTRLVEKKCKLFFYPYITMMRLWWKNKMKQRANGWKRSFSLKIIKKEQFIIINLNGRQTCTVTHKPHTSDSECISPTFNFSSRLISSSFKEILNLQLLQLRLLPSHINGR